MLRTQQISQAKDFASKITLRYPAHLFQWESLKSKAFLWKLGKSCITPSRKLWTTLSTAKSERSSRNWRNLSRSKLVAESREMLSPKGKITGLNVGVRFTLYGIYGIYKDFYYIAIHSFCRNGMERECLRSE